jgi:hypothetical protein
VLLRIWAGLSLHGITDKYTVEALKGDLAFRQSKAEQAGLGFTLPEQAAPIAPKMDQAFQAVGA